MQRRDFLTAGAGVAAMLPLAAHAAGKFQIRVFAGELVQRCHCISFPEYIRFDATTHKR